MTDCTFTKIEFPSCCKRRVEADFAGGEISSNGGALLLSLADRRVGLLSGLGRRLADRRQAGKVKHGLTGLLRQRVFAIALGDEDVNDHEVLRDDLVLQTACGGIGVWPAPRRLAVWSGRRTGAGLGRRMRRWWRASSPPMTRRRRNWCWTSIVRTMRCTAARRVAFSTAIMTTTAFCRSMSSVAISCWSAT